MIALAAAALAGAASAAICGETVSCPFGYRLKVMVRTTAGCAVTGTDPCGECIDATYRGPVIRRFMGLVYGQDPTGATGLCGETGCGCNAWNDSAYVAIYDYDNATPVTLDAATTELLQLNRIGCKAADRNKAEMAFSIGFTCSENVAPLTFAGFGLVGNHNGQITVGAISGYCAGLLPAGSVVNNGPCADPTSVCGNNVWNLCDNTALLSLTTAAYGKWTLVWDGSIASKVGVNLTASAATTGWGTATPVVLLDKRDIAQ